MRSNSRHGPVWSEATGNWSPVLHAAEAIVATGCGGRHPAETFWLFPCAAEEGANARIAPSPLLAEMKKIAGTSRSRRTRKAYRSVWWCNAVDYCSRLPAQKRTEPPRPDLMEPAKPGTKRRKSSAKRIAIPSLMAARELSEFYMSARLRRVF